MPRNGSGTYSNVGGGGGYAVSTKNLPNLAPGASCTIVNTGNGTYLMDHNGTGWQQLPSDIESTATPTLRETITSSLLYAEYLHDRNSSNTD